MAKHFSRGKQGGEPERVLDFEVIGWSPNSWPDGEVHIGDVEVGVLVRPLELLEQMGLPIRSLIDTVNRNMGTAYDIEAYEEAPVAVIDGVTVRQGENDEKPKARPMNNRISAERLALQDLESIGWGDLDYEKPYWLDSFRPVQPTSGNTSWRTLNALSETVLRFVEEDSE